MLSLSENEIGRGCCGRSDGGLNGYWLLFEVRSVEVNTGVIGEYGGAGGEGDLSTCLPCGAEGSVVVFDGPFGTLDPGEVDMLRDPATAGKKVKSDLHAVNTLRLEVTYTNYGTRFPLSIMRLKGYLMT